MKLSALFELTFPPISVTSATLTKAKPVASLWVPPRPSDKRDVGLLIVGRRGGRRTPKNLRDQGNGTSISRGCRLRHRRQTRPSRLPLHFHSLVALPFAPGTHHLVVSKLNAARNNEPAKAGLHLVVLISPHNTRC
jgi:hypothetical protein